MNPQVNFAARIGTALFWVLAAANAAVAILPAPYGMAFNGLAALILLAHLVEVGIFLGKYKEKSDNIALDAVQVLIFGVFHLERFQKAS